MQKNLSLSQRTLRTDESSCRKLLHKRHVMRSHNHSRALPGYSVKIAHYGLAGGRVKITGRLVSKNQRRLIEKSPRYHYALLLASRQLMRLLVLLALHTYTLKHI